MKINYLAPINELGYGQVGKHFLFELMKNATVSFFPVKGIEAIQCNSKDDAVLIKEALDNAESFDASAPCLKIWHQFDLAWRVGNGPYFAMPIFELDSFTKQEITHLSQVDRLIVNSEWAKQILVLNSIPEDKVDVCPLGYNPEIFTPVKNNRKTCVFLNVGKWEVRKGHDILIDAFNLAFDEEDDVELWMMTENPFPQVKNEEWETLYKSSRLGNKVKCLKRVATQRDVAYVMGQADCGVFPARAEGFNLEALEMMAMGKQIIATDYSGHTAFCNENNSLLVDVNKFEEAYDGIWFKGQGNWASFDGDTLEQLACHMKTVYQLKQADAIENSQGIATASDLTWEKCGQKLSSILSKGV